MSQVFPLRSSVELGDREPRLVDMDDERADEVFEALASGTTRRVLSALHEEPRTASDLAEVTDTSVQNAQYHLGKLQGVELIEPVDTWYSERGTEMTVYAPADEALVLFAGEDRSRSLRSLFKRVVGSVGLVALASLLVGAVTDQVVETPTAPAPESSDGAGVMTADGADQAARGAADAAGAAATLDPALLAGLACFVGGLVVLAAVAGVRYQQRRAQRHVSA
jgi:DNA-binding transcriptional ArsR family regulator